MDMNNIVSYAKEHMESFDVRPLNRVDSLIAFGTVVFSAASGTF